VTNRLLKIEQYLESIPQDTLNSEESALIIGGTSSDSWHTDNCGCI